MHLEDLIVRLENARRTPTGSYIARCPSHEDLSPSLTVRGGDDGRILLKCFAGCSTEEVVTSLGLTLSDLFPEQPISHARPHHRPFPLADVLRALTLECDLTVLFASKMARGEALTDADRGRLLLAARRINVAVAEAGL